MNGDLEWYTAISTERRLSTPRCPFAAVGRCPRYYQSLSLMGKAGSTRLEPKEDARLLKKWSKSELWPKTAEQATSVVGSNGNPRIFSQFCPEILHDRFGWFAESIAAYPDELDVDLAHSALGRKGVAAADWRWAWAQMTPMHYSECPVYSLLSSPSSAQPKGEILGLKPGLWGFSIDLRALWHRITKHL
jgi:hypothetical protein